jgi:hypothetical protein
MKKTIESQKKYLLPKTGRLECHKNGIRSFK